MINKLTQIHTLPGRIQEQEEEEDKLGMLEPGIKMEKEDVPIYDDIAEFKPKKEETVTGDVETVMTVGSDRDDRRHDDRRDRR